MVAIHGSSRESAPVSSSTTTDSKSFAKKRKKSASKNSQQRPFDQELLTRTSWVKAKVALNEVNKGNAEGNKPALWIRAKLQEKLFYIGRFVQCHAGKVLFLGLLVFLLFTLGLKNAKMENNMEKLWVEDGGRLEKELRYVEEHLGVGAGATNEMVIQTPAEATADDFSNVLTSEALLAHLDILHAASRVVVEKDDAAWKLRDLCYAQTIPSSEIEVLDTILENLFPCAIITPLDCFWEGSKLLGPDHPVHVPLGGDSGSMIISWTSLNPMLLLRRMSDEFKKYFDFRSFEEYMKRAGITSGYQEKPCLNPYDPDCPLTAPNKQSKQRPDIGLELTGGCYGFATRYNHWPEALVVGGTVKNETTGHIIRAKGLQSVVQVMGEKDLFEYWKDTYKTHASDWTPQVAKEILNEWQKKFSEEVQILSREKKVAKKFEINAFSTTRLENIMEEFSEFSLSRMALGYVFMLIYAGVSLFRWTDVVKSQSGLGIGGVFLVSVTIAGGLGLCAFIGIAFNATTTQIVPYLALGLGVDAIFLLVKNYAEHLMAETIAVEDRIGEVLSRTGVLILIIALCIIAAFLLAAAVIPLPAMRGLGIQAAILGAFNLITMIFIFPAVLALDLRRVRNGRMDVLCCYSKPERDNKTEDEDKWVGVATVESELDEERKRKMGVNAEEAHCWNLTSYASEFLGTNLTKGPVKLLVLTLYLFLTVAGIWGVAKVEDGLSMTDIVPRNTTDFRFLVAQDKYFGFYNMYAVTKGNFEYPEKQKLLYDYHNAFVRVPNIIKDDNGGFNEFWLSLFRKWLIKLQSAFDDNFAWGNYHAKGWHENATDDGVLAYKLMVQTGHVDYPVDHVLQKTNRLVDSHGIINKEAFYNYLTAWYNSDEMAYSFSQAALVPQPREWHHDPRVDDDFRIPKSPPIAYAQIPFYLNNLGETDTMVETIRLVREICDRFESKYGLPNFPRGIPFSFWEQYLNLRVWLLIALALIVLTIFAVLMLVFWSARLSSIGVIIICLMLVQLFGFMGILGIKLSAVPAVIIVLAAGMGVQFTVHILMGFATSVGNKNRRVYLAVKHMLSPVFHSAFTTFLGIIMLAFSDFDFIYRYFFLVITALLVLGLFNGLFFLPVMLSLIGPPAEVIARDGRDKIDPPQQDQDDHLDDDFKPRKSIRIEKLRRNNERRLQIRSEKQPSKSNFRRHDSDASLSTIKEESQTYVSSQNNTPQSSLNAASVYVEPEVTVETHTYPTNSSCQSSSSRCSTPNQVTKVTATAKFKVEVHAPSSSLELPSSSSARRPSSRRQRRRSSPTEESPASSVHSSLSSNEGDLGFSEK